MSSPRVSSAFVLGAGLGTRLRPLTDAWPKPLIPVFQKPLITFAMDHLISAGIERFAVNTHHAAGAYSSVFPGGTYREKEILFRHEDPVLETGGGIRNIRDWIGGETVIVYNGDILADVPLEPAIEAHFTNRNIVTLVLRSSGGPLHVACDEETGLVTDIRNMLETNSAKSYLLTGIYLIDPAFVKEIPAAEKISVVPIWLRMIQTGKRVGAVVVDDGHWWDLGNRKEYLRVHRELADSSFPSYPIPDAGWKDRIHPTAEVSPKARVEGSVIGPGVTVAAGAEVTQSILWSGVTVEPESTVRGCIVRHGAKVSGAHEDIDL